MFTPPVRFFCSAWQLMQRLTSGHSANNKWQLNVQPLMRHLNNPLMAKDTSRKKWLKRCKNWRLQRSTTKCHLQDMASSLQSWNTLSVLICPCLHKKRHESRRRASWEHLEMRGVENKVGKGATGSKVIIHCMYTCMKLSKMGNIL